MLERLLETDGFDWYDGRPPWGKQHTKTADELSILYPKRDDFVAVREVLDSEELLVNDHLGRVLARTQ